VTARNLLTDPVWQAGDLGHPIPDSPHATSVCLPLWAHAVGYEEGDEAVLSKLGCGYPRFVFHHTVRALIQRARERHAQNGEDCLVVPRRVVAERLCAYLQRRGQHAARIVDDEGLAVVLFASEAAPVAKAFWQHTGEIVSSRLAEDHLAGTVADPAEGAAAEDALRQRLATIYGVAPADVLLFTNGMAAMAAAKRGLDAVGRHRPSVQLGFPYVDVLKMQEQFGGGAHFVPGTGPRSLDVMRTLIARAPVSGCVIETPGNPLLSCPDIAAVSEMMHQHGGLLVIDDTIGSAGNIHVLPYADLVMGSLTKYFGGLGDVMGGSLVINPASPHATALHTALRDDHDGLLYARDAIVLEHHSRDYLERLRAINTNADRVAAFLAGHPAVDTVYHPSLPGNETFAKLRRPDGGNGGLLSFTLHDGATRAPQVYDKLRVSKGPSLGTNYTLACPYTILAHYHELDWAEEHGVSPHLIRVSVGLEDADDLIARFTEALASITPC
jgi:cystathionine gamma-synthase